MVYDKRLLIIAAVLIALQIVSTNACQSKQSKNGNDYIVGELTKTSVLAHSERFTNSWCGFLIWKGLFNITRIEVLDQTSGHAYLKRLEGGINTFQVRLTFDTPLPHVGDVDFIVKIYGEPMERYPSNDLILGADTPNSRLMETLVLNDNSQ